MATTSRASPGGGWSIRSDSASYSRAAPNARWEVLVADTAITGPLIRPKLVFGSLTKTRLVSA